MVPLALGWFQVFGEEEIYSVYNMVQKRPCQVCQGPADKMPCATPGARRDRHQRVLGRCLPTCITDRKVKCLQYKRIACMC